MSDKCTYFGKLKERTPDALWLTSRCQRVVNDFNTGAITEDAALTQLQSVGNTLQQAKGILELHRGRPIVKVKADKKPDPLRRAKR